MVFISDSGFVLVMTIFGGGQFVDPASHWRTEGVWSMLISCNKIGNIPGLIGAVMTPAAI